MTETKTGESVSATRRSSAIAVARSSSSTTWLRGPPRQHTVSGNRRFPRCQKSLIFEHVEGAVIESQVAHVALLCGDALFDPAVYGLLAGESDLLGAEVHERHLVTPLGQPAGVPARRAAHVEDSGGVSACFRVGQVLREVVGRVLELHPGHGVAVEAFPLGLAELVVVPLGVHVGRVGHRSVSSLAVDSLAVRRRNVALSYILCLLSISVGLLSVDKRGERTVGGVGFHPDSVSREVRTPPGGERSLVRDSGQRGVESVASRSNYQRSGT